MLNQSDKINSSAYMVSGGGNISTYNLGYSSSEAYKIVTQIDITDDMTTGDTKALFEEDIRRCTWLSE